MKLFTVEGPEQADEASREHDGASKPVDRADGYRGEDREQDDAPQRVERHTVAEHFDPHSDDRLARFPGCSSIHGVLRTEVVRYSVTTIATKVMNVNAAM